MNERGVRSLIGISAIGVYLPAYHLSREIIAQATGGVSLRGERTVANYDEDALTMGVEASLDRSSFLHTTLRLRSMLLS